MSTIVWLLLPIVYIALFITLALTTLRNGHYSVWVGIIFPALWIIGAIRAAEPQSRRAEARGAA